MKWERYKDIFQIEIIRSAQYNINNIDNIVSKYLLNINKFIYIYTYTIPKPTYFGFIYIKIFIVI